MLNNAVIDISHWNTITSFGAAKSAGVVSIIAKATEGSSYKDPTYAEREKQAKAAGLLWGAYHFLRPGNMSQQAQFFVDAAGDVDLYAADHEDAGVSLLDLKVFLSAVYALTGKRPVIYSGNVLKEQIGSERDGFLAGHRLWLAQYTSGEPSWPTATWPSWWLWQYTETGTCPGIHTSEGTCDLNRYDGTPEQLAAEWAGELVS